MIVSVMYRVFAGLALGDWVVAAIGLPCQVPLTACAARCLGWEFWKPSGSGCLWGFWCENAGLASEFTPLGFL
jgi:hypothetical protein